MESHVQWVIGGLAFYLVVVVIVSFVAAFYKPQRTMVAFFTANREFGSLAISLSMFATLFSAFTVIGIPGFFYTHGIGAWAFVAFADLALGFTFYFYGRRVVQLVRQYDLTSPVELLYTAYRSRFLSVLTVIVMGVFVMPFFSIQIAGMGKFLAGVSDNAIPYWVGALVMLFAMVLYSTIGGLRADVWTDIIQGIVMLIVMLIVSFGLLEKVWHFNIGEMFDTIVAQGKADLLSIPGPKRYFTLPTLISFFVLFLIVPVTFPHILSRFYATKSERAIFRTIIVFPILTLLMFIPGAIIGLAGAALFNLESGDMVMTEVLRRYFSPILAAALAIGVTGAAMSTSDSVLLALGSMFSRDVYKLIIHPDATEKKQMRVARLFMFALMAGGFIIALRPPRLIVQLAILSLEGIAVLAPAYIGAVSSKCPSWVAATSSIFSGLIVFVACETLVPQSWLAGFRPGLVGVVVAGLTYLVVAFLVRRHTQLEKGIA